MVQDVLDMESPDGGFAPERWSLAAIARKAPQLPHTMLPSTSPSRFFAPCPTGGGGHSDLYRLSVVALAAPRQHAREYGPTQHAGIP